MDPFVVLADPTRRRILESLCQGERSAGEIAADFEISNPAISQHLKVLRDAGMVSVRREAQRRIYDLRNNGGLDEAKDWLNSIRRLWNPRLDQLQNLLREEEHDE